MKNYLVIIVLFLLLSSQALFAQTCDETITATTPSSRFTVLAGEVKDHKTGLIWQQCSVGQSGNECSQDTAQRYTWSQALAVAQEEQYTTGLAWRLPNIKELRSIVEQRCVVPTINLTIFHNTHSSGYWSVSPAAYGSSYAWYVNFSYGDSGGNKKNDNKYIRLVRMGQ